MDYVRFSTTFTFLVYQKAGDVMSDSEVSIILLLSSLFISSLIAFIDYVVHNSFYIR